MRADEDNPNRPPKKNKVVQPARLGDYELHRSVHGFYSIRHISSGEIMHSVSAPSEEANQLYIEQSALAARLSNDNTEELVIWDVGLGAASNAMAAIHCFERCHGGNNRAGLRPLRLLSFEHDLDALTLAAKHSGCFPHLHHSAPSKILSQGSWRHPSEMLRWQLLQGDLRDLIESAAIPDLIFYDPFSFKTDAAAVDRGNLRENIRPLPGQTGGTLYLLRSHRRARGIAERRLLGRPRGWHRTEERNYDRIQQS